MRIVHVLDYKVLHVSYVVAFLVISRTVTLSRSAPNIFGSPMRCLLAKNYAFMSRARTSIFYGT